MQFTTSLVCNLPTPFLKLLSYLLGSNSHRAADDDQITGKLLETFVVTEILKQADWATTETFPYHYRERDDEVDLVFENLSGEIIGIEVKSAASLRAADLRGLQKLRDGHGSKFKAGIIVYTGAHTLPQGDRLWAMPVSGLWV